VDHPFEQLRRKLVAARIEFMGQLARFSKAEIAKHISKDEWSPLQVAHHLYVTDGCSLEHLKRVQEEDCPQISGAKDTVTEQIDQAEPPITLDAVLAGMAARREAIFEYLSQVPAEAWERPFQHSVWGELTFKQLVEMLPRHDLEHAEQLADIRAKLAKV
jgi:hypothetical protein